MNHPVDPPLRARLRTLIAPGILALLVVGATACRGTVPLAESDAGEVLAHQLLEETSPAEPGPHEVQILYYGSGTDRQRAVYRDSVAIRTPTVDASKLIDLGDAEEERNEYWGFGPDSFPLNARVWYPDGEGPFPLVLVVHGNHDPRDFSDPGYGYLGRLLASRGFILASVDMNFVNGGIREENDARGWLLLKHLEAWRGFDADPGNPFHGKVDLERISLIGHSRGGEAVVQATAFNRLSRYPDDATLAFDFGFDIRSIVAIAPVDGQYLPTDRFAPVRDVSYLVFHGSHDGDVTSFHGLRPYHRLRFTDGADRFKAAVYVYRANHGQWNTVWGAHDRGPRSARSLDLRGLLDPNDQRRFAEIYVSAFLEATLRDGERYLPLFRDHRVAGGWLPETMYVTRFQHSSFRPLATFEEDIDVTSGTEEGVRLAGRDLATWREGTLQLRSSNRPTTSASQDNQAVWLGWNREGGAEKAGAAVAEDAAGEEEGPSSGRRPGASPGADPSAPAFEIGLGPSLAREWGLDGSTLLSLALAPTREVPDPPEEETPEGGAAGEREEAGEETGVGRGAVGGQRGREEGGDAEGERPPMDVTVEVEDAAGRRATVSLRRYGPLRYPLETRILRRSDREEERFARLYELLPQTYTIPLEDFEAANPAVDLWSLRTVRFVFDRTDAGTVVLDDVGFSRPGPAYTRVRVEAAEGAGAGGG